MKLINTVFQCLLLMVANNLNAQTDTGRIRVFDNTEKNVFAGQDKPVAYQTLVKFDPYQLLNGDFPVYIERTIADNFSLEIAPGITFRDIYLDLFNVSPDGNKPFFAPQLPYGNPYKAGLGYSFKIDARYFPGKDNMMEGAYFSPEFGYRHYVLQYSDLSAGGTTTYSNGSTNVTDFKFLVGHESDAWVDGFYLDFYIGLGLRHISGSEYGNVTTTAYNSYYGYPVTQTTWEQTPFAYWRPGFYWGFKLGFVL